PVGTLPVLTLTIGLLTIALVRRTVGGRTGAVARAGVGVDRLGLGGAVGAGTHSRRVVDLARRTGVVLSDAGPGSIGSGLAGGEALRRRLAVFGPSVAVPVADLTLVLRVLVPTGSPVAHLRPSPCFLMWCGDFWR